MRPLPGDLPPGDTRMTDTGSHPSLAARPVVCRAGVGFVIAVASLVWPSAAAAQQRSIDDLLQAYAAGDYQVLSRYVATPATFEEVRKELGFEKEGRLHGAMQRWHEERRPAHSVFTLELALVASSRGWPHWTDVLGEAARFLVNRPAKPGEDREWDAFEIAWHKTSVALLQGLGRPDRLREHGIQPLASRMSAERAVGMLVDPWVAMARGVNDEQFARVGGLTQIAPAVETWAVNSDHLLEQHFLRALEEFRTSYVVRYAPAGVERRGWHDVSVRAVKAGRQYQVRARRGDFGAR
jgi:hypothetical protein